MVMSDKERLRWQRLKRIQRTCLAIAGFCVAVVGVGQIAIDIYKGDYSDLAFSVPVTLAAGFLGWWGWKTAKTFPAESVSVISN